MLVARPIRADRVMRTSVVEPTTHGFQPVRAAQQVATNFTRFYGPVIWSYKYKQPADVGTANKIRSSLAKGRSAVMQDNLGRVIAAHPIMPGGNAPTVPNRPGQIVPSYVATDPLQARLVEPRPNVPYNRQDHAAQMILINYPSNLPRRGTWDPAGQSARRIIPREAMAAADLATRLTRGPQAITRPAVATALNRFRNTGRYY